MTGSCAEARWEDARSTTVCVGFFPICIVMIKRTILSLALLGTAAWFGTTQGREHAGPAHWSYAGKTGPEHWAELDPAYATCKLGHAQSPIDIRDTSTGKPVPVDFAYTAGAASVVNNGHTVEFDVRDGGSIRVDAIAYQLANIHFHTPSEERFAGKVYPMAAHLVHRDGAGNLAVVAVMFEEGEDNAALAPIFAAMPKRVGKSVKLAHALDASAFLPAERAYYAFTGSLTTPPCSEGVQWRVLKQPVRISPAQLDTFRRLYPMNARPVQKLNDRKVEG